MNNNHILYFMEQTTAQEYTSTPIVNTAFSLNCLFKDRLCLEHIVKALSFSHTLVEMNRFSYTFKINTGMSLYCSVIG